MATVKLVFGMVLLAASVYAGMEVFPLYLANFQLEDAMQSEAQINAYSNVPEEKVRQAVLAKARELGLPLAPEQIHVERIGMLGSNRLLIEANYSVAVDLPIYPIELHFSPSSGGGGFKIPSPPQDAGKG